MEQHRWKVCQECGAVAIKYHNRSGERLEVKCPRCGISEMYFETWDERQAATRARKHHDMVCAVLGGMSANPRGWPERPIDVQCFVEGHLDIQYGSPPAEVGE